MQIQTFEQLPAAMSLVISRLESLEQLMRKESSASVEPLKEYLTVEEAAEFLSLTPATIYGLCCRREIPFYKKGKRSYFNRLELASWIKGGRHKTKSEVWNAVAEA